MRHISDLSNYNNFLLNEIGFNCRENVECEEFNGVIDDQIYIFDCIDNGDLEIYDVSFLNVSQLLVDGDVESNPGPTDNVDKTPKGKGRRKGTPKKNKGLKGTPNKLRKVDGQNIGSVDSINTRNISDPSGLKNYPNQNVCFFNSVIQVLSSVESFREISVNENHS